MNLWHHLPSLAWPGIQSKSESKKSITIAQSLGWSSGLCIFIMPHMMSPVIHFFWRIRSSVSCMARCFAASSFWISSATLRRRCSAWICSMDFGSFLGPRMMINAMIPMITMAATRHPVICFPQPEDSDVSALPTLGMVGNVRMSAMKIFPQDAFAQTISWYQSDSCTDWTCLQWGQRWERDFIWSRKVAYRGYARHQEKKPKRTSRDAPTGHKLFNFISRSLQPRRWAHI